MKQYLKMADVFVHDSVEELEQHIYAGYMSKHCSEYAAHAINSHDELVAQRNELLSALEQCRDAFEYTRQYVGYETLPSINGWSWFDADQRAKDAIAKAKGGAA